MSQFRPFAIAVATALLTITAQAGMIELTPVGNPGNAPDAGGYGDVDYAYHIGKYEVTAGQYTQFLNAVARTDTYGLYNANMWSSQYGCQIQQIGSPDNYAYSVAAVFADRPVNYVSFWDAARFANWLHNGQPTGAQGAGTTEDGAYINIDNQSTFARQPDALFFIPTEDEWYKAAYHDADSSYYDYPTASDISPSNVLTDPDPGNNATFNDSGVSTIGHPYYRTEVGAHENSDSHYGTFDQGGNVWEWNEAIVSGSSRGLRGGSYVAPVDRLLASFRASELPTFEHYDVGFRVGSAVPEPGSFLLAGLGAMGIAGYRLRRRERRSKAQD